ncbi:MAG TPA: NAD(P)/FAD-dependent oxidoreductase [Candidatus Angelobacter sp.]|nr:NAD(P)/FAD-dependent oxidoreductase [Candidatus Angelobacter sp.]
MTDVIVIGAGPAGVMAAMRAAELGAATALITRDEFGGMAANDGPIPVRTLAHAARLMRESRQLGRYGVAVSDLHLEYPRLLDRVREVVNQVRSHSAFRADLDRLGVTLYEHTGNAHFVDSHTVEGDNGLRLTGEKIILCAGGCSRKLRVPGSELTATHSDAWHLTSIPPSVLVIGAGATGAQVASIFNAFGSKVHLYEAGPRILPTEDEDVSTVVAQAFRDSGITVHENFGTIEGFQKSPTGVRMTYAKNGTRVNDEASVIIVAIGWAADTAGLHLQAAGVNLDSRGYVSVDSRLRTSAPHIFAAGDITGRLMLVPQAARDGFVAATNAVHREHAVDENAVNPIGSFTDPEYAQVGLTEAKARETHDILVSKVPYEDASRPLIDGRTTGFCKLIVDRKTHTILGCHIVGERAVEIIQMASIAMIGGVKVDEVTRIPLAFPTYTGVLLRAVYLATAELGRKPRPDLLDFAA